MADDDKREPGTVWDIIIDQLAFPRGGGAVMAKVQICLEPNTWERDGAEITILTGVPWDRDTDITDAVRRRAAASAHRLLKAAAALSEDDFLQLLDRCLYEEDLPELHHGRQRH